MGDNAYRLELLDKYGVPPVFNVVDLVPFMEPLDSRTSLSLSGENGATIADQARIQA